MKKEIPRKRIDIVKVQLVKRSSILYQSRRCDSPEKAYELLGPFIEDCDRECLVVAGLNVKNEPNFIQIAHIGAINHSVASPREILKPALLSSSITIVIAHNHCSGDTTPSLQDIEFTVRLEKACELFQIKLQDHLIVGFGGQYRSMRQEGDIH